MEDFVNGCSTDQCVEDAFIYDNGVVTKVCKKNAKGKKKRKQCAQRLDTFGECVYHSRCLEEDNNDDDNQEDDEEDQDWQYAYGMIYNFHLFFVFIPIYILN